jgi:nicotinamide riboside transporter PnuC
MDTNERNSCTRTVRGVCQAIEGSTETFSDRWFIVQVIANRLLMNVKLIEDYQILQNVVVLFRFTKYDTQNMTLKSLDSELYHTQIYTNMFCE